MKLPGRWPPDPDAPPLDRGVLVFIFCLGIAVGAIIVEASYRFPSPIAQGTEGQYLVFEQKNGRLVPAENVHVVVDSPK